jgi:hypothetical protein
MMDARSIAQALGGVVQSGAVLAPGPGHKPYDRSLRVYSDPDADNGFRVLSFVNDDPMRCRDYVAQKLGLPAWRPSRPRSNGRSKPSANIPVRAQQPLAAPMIERPAPEIGSASEPVLPSRFPTIAGRAA